jgi:hypothetical protein
LGGYKAYVAPEFLGFLRHYKSEGKKHIYFNHQDMRKLPATKENERVRCELLHKTASSEEFKGTFCAVTFSQNSPFYEQEHKHLPKGLDFNITEKYLKDEARKWFAKTMQNTEFNFEIVLQKIIDEKHPSWVGANDNRFGTEEGKKIFYTTS